MSSIVPASFNTTVGSTLQAFLTPSTTSTTSPGVLGVLQESKGTNNGGVIGLLQTQSSSAASATTLALSTGGIKTEQHKVLQAIGSSSDGTLIESWNTNGTEPTTLANLRSDGWIKLTGKVYDATTKTYQASYQFTAVGYAIYQRTGGNAVSSGSSSSALSSSTLNGTGSSSSSSASSQTAAISSELASLGFTSSSVAALAGNNTTSTSTTTGSVLNVLA